MISLAELANIAGVPELELRGRLRNENLLSGQGGWEAQARALAEKMRREREK